MIRRNNDQCMERWYRNKNYKKIEKKQNKKRKTKIEMINQYKLNNEERRIVNDIKMNMQIQYINQITTVDRKKK